MKEITQIVADFYNVPYDDLFIKNRARRFVKPRQVAMYMARMLTTATATDIGKFFKQDHATVLHSVNIIKGEIKFHPPLRDEVEKIMTLIMAHPELSLIKPININNPLKESYSTLIFRVLELAKNPVSEFDELVNRFNEELLAISA